jgi:hypothetical protein
MLKMWRTGALSYRYVLAGQNSRAGTGILMQGLFEINGPSSEDGFDRDELRGTGLWIDGWWAF